MFNHIIKLIDEYISSIRENNGKLIFSLRRVISEEINKIEISNIKDNTVEFIKLKDHFRGLAMDPGYWDANKDVYIKCANNLREILKKNNQNKETNNINSINKEPGNIINNFNGHVSNLMVQQNSNDSIQVQNNTGNLNEETIGKVIDLLEIIKENIPKITEISDSDAQVLYKEVENIEHLTKSNNLTKKILKEGLDTIRNLIEGATGSIIASGIMYKIGLFSNSL